MQQAFVNVNPNDEMVDRLLFTLLQNQSGGYWTNTATTARVLDAIHAYIKMRNLDDTDFTADVNLGGKQLMKESFKGVAAKPKTLKLPFENELISSLEKDTTNAVTFNKDGNGRLYYTIEMKYALPDEMQSARNEGISLDYQITDYETGEVINTSGKDDSVLTLESGKMYKATIRLESNRDRTYIAMRAPIPSGAEILDSTFVTTSSAGEVTSSSESWGHWLSKELQKQAEKPQALNMFLSMMNGLWFTNRAFLILFMHAMKKQKLKMKKEPFRLQTAVCLH